MNKESNVYLSKSLFIRGLQCHKSLYLHKYHPELKDEISEGQKMLFQSGIDVGAYAKSLFPGGVEILYDDVTLADQLDRTEKEIANGTKVLYEAAFSYDNIFVKVDILRKTKKGWEIYEVKGSTGVKDIYYDDVAIQYYVLKGSGLTVAKASLVHINNQYVRHGEIEIDKLFTIEDLTVDIIAKQEFVKGEILKMRKMLNDDEPDIDIGHHCSDPYECHFCGYCWRHIPEYSVFNLKSSGPDKFNLYRQGIIRLEDIPRDILPRNQRIQLEGTLDKKDITNKSALREFLDTLWYPICFLDFETTFMVPIPMFDDTRPYQQVPFQYSLHCLEDKNAVLQHYEYLAPAHIDPRRELTEKLLSKIPEDACVLTYNKAFETGILNGLTQMFPEYKEKIEKMIDNIRDLMAPFRNKDIYRHQMEGSYSLKYVLPALIPELSYDGMGISDGAMASSAWLNLWEIEDTKEIKRMRNALLEYCELDTLAMVRILEKLREYN
ncbi:MAG: DUF2779 domain-containing protein [Thermodesulfobacteriota bacterium]|nr:DUF2779 domain-containing protein [Thermodesulfobacteriota bacterium]